MSFRTAPRLGDWKGDTVYRHGAYLVTLVHRKSRLTLIGKVDNKNSEIVANKMIELPRRARGSKTITLDNGAEFAMHSLVSKAVKADIYYAKPYASYQRGTNENTNIIRRHWPKKTAFGQFSEVEMRLCSFK
ncbi:IS30 family transposase [Endozoicomonas sp. ONNA2]|uniref:IS30 family transposase n=1 Tax=Endozoicomonas sp. ONNA2 TaxID=2828741 RepID=UPI00214756EF